jgi:hypothetical protein
METKVVEIEGKKVYINPAPATVGYDVALRYREAMGDKDHPMNPKEVQECLYELLKYAELDLGDGRKIKLDNKTLIDQHFKNPTSLLKLQKETGEVNFGFLADSTHSAS